LSLFLAAIQSVRTRYGPRKYGYKPFVTVLIPALNEDKVILRTISHLLRSDYKNMEVLVVDDGSSDRTLELVRERAKRSKRLRVVHQENHGKAAASNFGIKHAKGEIIITADADTLFTPQTVGRFVRHFYDPRVGGVAGNVKVGNVRNPVTLWQALDYIIGIHIERTAQALLHTIVVVPGSCGAWRKQALIDAGGYSRRTLSEDCDVTLSVQKRGYRILQDSTAIAYTEAPTTIRALSRQRFRWLFGNIQSFFKHRDILFRPKYGLLGFLTLPNLIISILMPILFMPLLVLVGISNMMHGNWEVIVLFLVATLCIQFGVALCSILMARERLIYVFAVPLTRLIYGPLRTYLLYRSVIVAAKGASVGWNKLSRTGSLAYIPSATRPRRKVLQLARH
jgi:biofilm PGA synthesis N-glycosyltransferase PgaC